VLTFLFIFNDNIKAAPRKTVESCMYDLEINIIKKIQSGDANAFEQIVDKFKDKALTLSMRILKNREDAEDSLQEAFVKTFRAITDKQFEERSKFSTYFYRIVYNTALDYYKKHKLRNYNLLKIDEPSRIGNDDEKILDNFELNIDEANYEVSGAFITEKRTLDGEMQLMVDCFLEQIPEKYATILTLFYINDLTHEEIAQTLRLPIGTVKNRIFRAKDKLKEVMLKKNTEEDIMELF
jgi:RNA polymerase sigma-70 factor (ECF subfamily)